MVDMNQPVVTLDGLQLSRIVEPETGVRWLIDRDAISGWWSSPAPRLSSADRVRAHGVWVGDSWLTARTVAIEGYVVGPTRASTEDAINRLEAACALAPVGLTIVDSSGDSPALSASVRRSDQVLISWLSRTAAKWSIQLLADDPRRLGDELSASTGLPSVSGGLTIGEGETLGTVPFAIESTIVSGSVSIINPGTIAGPVTLRIAGPVNSPAVTHVGASGTQVFAMAMAIGPGEYIDIDMDRRTVLAQGQASRSAWVSQRGWSSLDPGVNRWGFAAAAPGDGVLTVTARPAWM